MKYELTLIIRNDNDKMEMEKINADDILHLASQVMIMFLRIQQKEHDSEVLALRMEDDDIPF